ncbi:SDR family oxidoreductase [Nesterenkonia marinintestina]|uniref:SDR family oxidoreductase n=1 Tax=Nesterenkonia marinintestina TaxID=2979865 RepID=UPI0021C03722|nr:SDR family oxidoreductase [Nesterenkonia sp. GX14115]
MTQNTSAHQLQGPQSLAGRTVLISGGSRGIGHAIAVALAARGAHIALLAKTDQPHPSLEGTVHTAVADVEAAGGRGLAVVGDVRSDEDVDRAVAETVQTFGGIDVLINNASAIDLTPAPDLPMKRYDLMHDINVRGTYRLTQAAVPHLRTSAGRAAKEEGGGDRWAPKVLTLAPPLNLDPEWFGRHLGYTMAKYGMTMTTLGFARTLADVGAEVNSLWPATLIDTAAIRAMPDGEALAQTARSPQIMADAALALLTGAAGVHRGEFLTDEQVLAHAGLEDLSGYAVDPAQRLTPDIFL